MSNQTRTIFRQDVIGQVLTAIHSEYELVDDWLDCVTVYFQLNSGLVLYLGTDSIHPAEISADSKQWVASDWDYFSQVVGQTIVSVSVDEESVFLVLSNGYAISPMLMAPQGTGGAGLYGFTPEEYAELEDITELKLPERNEI